LYSRVLTRLSGPRSRPAASQKIWKRWESNPGPLHLQPETLPCFFLHLDSGLAVSSMTRSSEALWEGG
jgi:hypothetical protein